MVSRLSEMCACSYLNEALTPVKIPSNWDRRKVYAVLQNGCVGLSVVSAISAIFTAIILSVPLFLLSLSVTAISLLVSYQLKKMLFVPTPQISVEKDEKMFEEATLHLTHRSAQVDQKVDDLFYQRLQIEYFPESVTKEVRKEIEANFTVDSPEPFTEKDVEEIEKEMKENSKVTDDQKVELDSDDLDWDLPIPAM